MTNYASQFNKYIQLTINNLKEKNYSQAEENIKQAMLVNPHSPVVQNLYGILEELLREDHLALKHYRAAYAFDPTYEPAIRNLKRITSIDHRFDKIDVDFGDKPSVLLKNIKRNNEI